MKDQPKDYHQDDSVEEEPTFFAKYGELISVLLAAIGIGLIIFCYP